MINISYDFSKSFPQLPFGVLCVGPTARSDPHHCRDVPALLSAPSRLFCGLVSLEVLNAPVLATATTRSKSRRNAVIQETDSADAGVTAKIFRLHAEHRSLSDIAEILNGECKWSTEAGFRPLRWVVSGPPQATEEE